MSDVSAPVQNIKDYLAGVRERDIAEARRIGQCMGRTCDGTPEIGGLCMRCYQRIRRGTRASQDAIAMGRELAKSFPCVANGCDRMAEVASAGTCNAHYHRVRVHKSYALPPRKRPVAPFSAPTEKLCKTCGETKPAGRFTRVAKAYDGLSGKCNTCRRQYDRDKGYRRLAKYGLSKTAFEAMRDAQGGMCGICGQPPEGRTRGDQLYVDHCHATGKVRGLLCHDCNISIGWMRDSPERLEAAAAYLRERG